MNAGYAQALVIVDELVRCGLRHAALAPGSRSTPLALALDENDAVTLHVCLDERSAAFLALGAAKVTGRPALVLSTSGTAAANFHPAVIEADVGRAPLIVVTADRPPELRDTGANQTIDQIKLFGGSVRLFADTGVAEVRPAAVRYWRSLADRVWARAAGAPAGPVHLNVPLREPLGPAASEGEAFDLALDGRRDGAPWTVVEHAHAAPAPELVESVAGECTATERGLVVVGHGTTPVAGANAVARALGWPLLAEAASGARHGELALSTYDALLRSESWATRHRPDVVLRVGSATLSKALTSLADEDVRQIVVDEDAAWLDPGRGVAVVVRSNPTAFLGALARAVTPRTSTPWLDSWVAADTTARGVIDTVLDEDGSLNEARAARDLADALPAGACLAVASSMPVRDLDWFMRPRAGVRFVANRGASGIDGFVSTALGAAAAHDGPAYALAGDLSLLHDSNGFLSSTSETRPLTMFVLNNDGGRIFSFLRREQFAGRLEKLFVTPHGRDLEKLAAFHDLRFTRVARPHEIAEIVRGGPPGIHLVEIPIDPEANLAVHRRAWEAVARTVA